MGRTNILNTPIAFIVVGTPGSGKSWFSRSISKNLHCIHLDSERIRFELFEEQSYNDEEEVVVENMVDYFAHTLTQSRASMIFDGTTSSIKRRKELYKFAEKNEYQPVLVWVQSNDELSKMRASSKVNKSVAEYKRKLTADQYDSLINKFEKPHEKEKPIVISGNHSARSQLKSIVTRLNEMDVISLATNEAKKVAPASSESQVDDQPIRRNTQRIG